MKTLLVSLLLAVCASFSFAQSSPPTPMHIALMFDDGPTAEHLEKYLALFKTENVHVTFSFVAKNVEAQPALAHAAISAGHEVTNHSFEHKHPKDLSPAELRHEVIGALEVFERVTNKRPTWYWPPYIEITPELEAIVAKTSMKLYRPAHLVGSSDYDMSVTAEQIRIRSLDGVKDGSLILFHEWRNESLEQMPAILAELKKRGAVFMTISELTNYLGTVNSK
ncbi:MAG: polysaccharide deacetylase family protein [Nibricoccus sp.]